MKGTIVSIFWHRFRDDRRGNVAMIAALSMLGLVGTAGLGIDYFNALAAKSRLDLASDAAAIAAINAAQSYIGANSGTQTDPALSAAAIRRPRPKRKMFSRSMRGQPPISPRRRP
jgi:Flp pilus assembly protein TadG